MRPPDLAGIRARVLLIRGRYDWVVPVEVSIALLNHIAGSRLVLLNNCGNLAQFRETGRGDRAGRRVPQGY